MQATTETRQRMILAVTGLLTPVVFWLAFGLYDRYAPKPRWARQATHATEPLFEEGSLPPNLRPHLLEAAQQGDWERVQKMADEACGENCPPLIVPLQAEAYWRLGKPQQAAELWSPLLPWQGPVGQADYQALKGDRTGYKSFVAPLLTIDKPLQPNDTAWACLLLPDALTDYTPVVALAQKALNETESREGRANTLNTLGVALYRAGRYDEALARLQESEQLAPEMMNIVFLALCFHKQGNAPRARREADIYYQFLQSSLRTNSRNRAEYLLFEKELRAVLPPKKATQPVTKATAQ